MRDIERVGIVFSGGPAPGANAVVSAAVGSFIEDGREVVGFFHGYSHLHRYEPGSATLREGEHYHAFDERDLRGLRNQRGIVIGTARDNPGRSIQGPADLDDLEKTRGLRNVYGALCDLELDALISIGGDDTLKTANYLFELQERMPSDARRVQVIHLPKTIDNDYHGIDFTFGFFTAVDVMAKELMNLRADALATSCYYVVETMGRNAGWLSYGVAIAGEAHLVIGVEDLDESLCEHEGGELKLSVGKLAERIVDLILTRETRDKHYGTVVLAEGLAQRLGSRHIGDVDRDDHGHIALGRLDLAQLVSDVVGQRYLARTGRKKKLRGIQLGYEARCSPPHAFDVMLGSQLGVGGYRGLVEEGLDGHMVSVTGQLELLYVPFSELIDPKTLKAEVRYIDRNSDFHKLARLLETRSDPKVAWSPGRRPES